MPKELATYFLLEKDRLEAAIAKAGDGLSSLGEPRLLQALHRSVAEQLASWMREFSAETSPASPSA